MVDAADERGHLHGVVDGRRTETEALPGLVELRREGAVHVEMARRDRQIRGLQRAPAFLVDDVERTDDADVVDEVGEVAGAPATIDVRDERRPADRAEHEMAGAEDDVPFRVARVERELGRRGRDELLDLGGVEADVAGEAVHSGARPGKRVEHAIAQDLEADLGEDPERGPVDGLDLVLGQDLDRAERVGQPPPGELLDARGLAPRSASVRLGRVGVAGRGGGVRRLHLRRCYRSAPSDGLAFRSRAGFAGPICGSFLR